MSLELIRLDNDDLNIILDIIRSDDILYNTFKGSDNTISRVLLSCYSSIIKVDGVIIGFVMIVDNQGVYEVDMGIIGEYKNNGYGTKALNILKNIIIKNNIESNTIIQTRKDNLSAINSIVNTGLKLIKEDKIYNYYGFI